MLSFLACWMGNLHQIHFDFGYDTTLLGPYSTLIMYYKERFDANEMPTVLYKMRQSYEKAMAA